MHIMHVVYLCMHECVCGGMASFVMYVLREITLALNHAAQSGCHTHTYHCQLLLLPKKQTHETKLASLAELA